MANNVINQFQGMNALPTLVIGIGGIGSRIVANLDKMIPSNMRGHVSLICMDTDQNDLSKVDSSTIETIRTSDTGLVNKYLEGHMDYLTWFPSNPFLMSKSINYGAGQVRTVSRLAALKCEEQNRFSTINSEIVRITTRTGANPTNNLAVVIVGSITGGTGAGLFLQVPFLVREYVKNIMGLSGFVIRGMFIDPDITADVNPSQLNREAVRVNAFSCLRELNALYMGQMDRSATRHLEFEHYHRLSDQERQARTQQAMQKLNQAGAYDPQKTGISITDMAALMASNSEIPYDYLYLVEKSNTHGSIGNVTIPGAEMQTARMLYTMLFTPLGSDNMSVEDNLVLIDSASGGMARYGGVGIASLVYPEAEVKRYVRTAAVRDLVDKQWLIIDKIYQANSAVAQNLKKTDPTVKIPALREEYIGLFRAKVLPGEECVLGDLYEEAFMAVEEGASAQARISSSSDAGGAPSSDAKSAQTGLIQHISKSSSFTSLMNKKISEVINSVSAAKAACAVDSTKMKKLTNAEKEVKRVQAALRTYAALAKSTVETKSISVANALLPPDEDTMQNLADQKLNNNIYSLLSGVHPLTARFFIYEIIAYLRQTVRRNERIAGSFVPGKMMEDDYDRKEPDEQTPKQALDLIGSRKIPVLNVVFMEESRIEKFNKIFKNNVTAEEGAISAYLDAALKVRISRVLLERFEKLADNYEAFFRKIEEIIRENDSELKRMESGFSFPYGRIGVYCSEEALKKTAEAYVRRAGTGLPGDTMRKLFRAFFKQTANDLRMEREGLSDEEKDAQNERKKQESFDIFQFAINEPIEHDVQSKVPELVSLNIMEALQKEFFLEHKELNPSDQKAKTACEDYIKERIREVIGLAEPTVAADSAADSTDSETCYVCVHPSCLVTSQGTPSIDQTVSTYFPVTAGVPGSGSSAQLLAKMEFDCTELFCFRTRLKCKVEELVQYRSGSVNYECYHKRLDALNGYGNVSGTASIPPHINRYWHEPWFLPALHADDRQKEADNIRKAFVYGLAYDMLYTDRYEDPEGITNGNTGTRWTWYFENLNERHPLKMCGQYIGLSPAALYDALWTNSRVVTEILAASRRRALAEKGFTSAEELREEVFSSVLVEDLAQSVPMEQGDDAYHERNIFDIFSEMRTAMPAEEWEKLFDGLEEVLWEYEGIMLDHNPTLINSVVPSVSDHIFSHSAAGRHRSAGEEMSFGDQALENQKDRIRNKAYIG